MKSVLISIRPQWVEKIASGEKTIEVRKTKPKLEIPFKCLIYQTKSKDNAIYKQYKVDDIRSGKVINKEQLKQIGLSVGDLAYYGQGKPLYGWHISDLKIYDKPKGLEMFPIGKIARDCGCGGYIVYNKILTRPPQSWCYVEELSE